MPIPKTKDVGKIIEFLSKENPEMPRAQKIAIALRISGQAKKRSKNVKKKKKNN